MKILVTGASGTVGRRICRRLVLDGHEPVGFGRDIGPQLVGCPSCAHEVGDVEDYFDLERAAVEHRVAGIIHAAANKHVELCERRPSLAVRCNILGTLNVLDLARSRGLDRVVLVSTDKASSPDQVYGLSKYLGERLAEEYAALDGMPVTSVRFGNVFGSTGSVVPIWKSLIDAGRDIELRCVDTPLVPNPLVRFAMLPSEAADFCCRVFLGDYPAGAVVATKMRVVDIGVLARCMVAGSMSGINRRPLAAGENSTECLLTGEEVYRSERVGAEWVVAPRQGDRGWRDAVLAKESEALSPDATAEFLRRVLEEMD